MFQRAVDHSLRRVKDIAAAYVDDILIMTLDQGSEKSTILKHEKDVRLVMEELKAHKLVADKKLHGLSKMWSFEATFWGEENGGPHPGNSLPSKIGNPQQPSLHSEVFWDSPTITQPMWRDMQNLLQIFKCS